MIFRMIYIPALLMLSISGASSFAKANDSGNIQQSKSHQPSEILESTKDQLLRQMGIYPSDEDNSEIALNFPAYPNSLIVINKPFGMNYDDTLTLPLATLITEDSVNDVATFYKSKLKYYEMFQNGDEIVFVDKFVEGGKWPQDYYRIPSISIHVQKLANGKNGTIFTATYQN
jgi:hypothetical protein